MATNDLELFEEEAKNIAIIKKQEEEKDLGLSERVRPLFELVEETFSRHFAENGEKAVDMLSKVDPAAYIKQVVAILPKKVALKSESHSTYEVRAISHELRQMIDVFSERIPETKENIMIQQAIEQEEDIFS